MPENGYAMLIVLILLTGLIGMAVTTLADPYLNGTHRRTMLLLLLLTFTMIVQNNMEYLSIGRRTMVLARTVTSVYGYCIRPLMLVLLLRMIHDGKKRTWLWGLVVVNALIYMTAFFSHISVWFDADNYFHRGPLGYSCHAVSFLLLLVQLLQVIRESRRVRSPDMVIPFFCAAIIIAATVADTTITVVHPVSYQTIAVVISCVFYYLWVHIRFVREHEQALLAEQRIQIMISQIQPHFLYNTLSTIQALCLIDPEKAAQTLSRFGVYLRQNINSLNEPGLVPFEKELEHTRTYAEIESIRFPSIQMEYEIEDTDFSVPALTVQPLVENAIRHGVRVRSSGLVTVRTWQERDGHVIEIRDNGKGFNVESLTLQEPDHIGLRNVRDRLKALCGGTMEIESRINEGTAVTLRIPRGREEK